MLTPNQPLLPIQPVNKPILCSPYAEPTAHWVYDTTTGAASPLPAGVQLATGTRPSAPAVLSATCSSKKSATTSRWSTLRDDVRRWRQALRGCDTRH